MYSKTELMEKTVAELRAICRELDIPGMSKKRKDIIVDAIVKATSGSSKSIKKSVISEEREEVVKTTPLTSLSGTFQTNITDPTRGKGKRLTTFLRVSCGASSGDFNVAGKTVGAVSEFLKEILNIPTMSKGIVDGKEAKDSYILKDSDTLEFIKPAGDKG